METAPSLLSATAGQPAPFSPATLLALCASEMRTPFDGMVIHARGIFQMRHNNREYSGYYYDQLLSPNDNKTLRVRIHHRLRSTLQDNHIYTFRGVIEKKVAFSYIDLVFNADEVVLKEEKKVSDDDLARFEVIRQKAATGYRNVEALVKLNYYAGRKTRLVNVYGNNAVVQEDFRKGLGAAAAHFEITELRCNMTSPAEIVQIVRQLDDCDIAGLVRGGGDTAGMRAFEDVTVAGAIAASPVPVVTAVGHAVDDSLADKVADRKFALPYDYGNHLKQWTEEAAEEQSRSKTAFIDQVKQDLEKTFNGQITTLKEQLENKHKELEQARLNFAELVAQLNKEKAETIEAGNKVFEARLTALAEQIRMKESAFRELQATQQNVHISQTQLAIQEAETKLAQRHKQVVARWRAALVAVCAAAVIALLIAMAN